MYGKVCCAILQHRPHTAVSTVSTWYGMVWYGMVWHGMAWHGMVYGTSWNYITSIRLRKRERRIGAKSNSTQLNVPHAHARHATPPYHLLWVVVPTRRRNIATQALACCALSHCWALSYCCVLICTVPLLCLTLGRSFFLYVPAHARMSLFIFLFPVRVHTYVRRVPADRPASFPFMVLLLGNLNLNLSIEYRPGIRWRDLTCLLSGVARRILMDGTRKTSSP